MQTHHVILIGKALLLILWLPTVCDSFSSPQRQYPTSEPGSSSYVALTNSSEFFSLQLEAAANTAQYDDDDAGAWLSSQAAGSSSTRLLMQADGSFAEGSNDLPLRVLGRVRNYLTFPIRRMGRLLRRVSWRHPTSILFEPTAAETATNHASTLAQPQVGGTADDTAVAEARSATATVDMSGSWVLLVTEEFKQEYDEYLRNLGIPFLVRSVAMNLIARTTEETVQTDQGRSLLIRSINVKGVWERTLFASSSSGLEHGNDSSSFLTPVMTADGEEVLAEAWWEQNGTVHRSWLRDITRYGGGSFESIRYLEQDGTILVCESIFHPHDKKRKKATITWKFQKQQETP